MSGSNSFFRRFYLLSGIVLAGWYLIQQRSSTGPWYWVIGGFLVIDMLVMGFTETKKLRQLGDSKIFVSRPVIWLICLLLMSSPFVLTYTFGKAIFQHTHQELPLVQLRFLCTRVMN